MSTIRITGDIIRNTNLVRLPADASRPTDQLPKTSLRREFGGAYHLARMIDLSCSDLDVSITGTVADDSLALPGLHRYPEAVSIWTRHERSVGDGAWVWRVDQFLQAESSDTLFADTRELLNPMSSNRFRPPGGGTVARILVIDDENFGFRDQQDLWQSMLEHVEPDEQIVLKTRAPLGTSALWKHLVDEHADRLTVVVPVSSLRVRHAAIARALSWDRAIEDVHRELLGGASNIDLGRASRVVIPFSLDGVAIFSQSAGGKLSLDRFIYHPEFLEGDIRARHPGLSFGGGSILTAALVRHIVQPDSYPLFMALGRALAAMTSNHVRGGGPAVVNGHTAKMLVPFTQDLEAHERLRSAFHWIPTSQDAVSPESAYRSAFHRAASRFGRTPDTGVFRCSLLAQVTGPGGGHSLATSIQAVLNDPDTALDAAPRARYGAFLTVDREEIERTSEIRRLLGAYRRNSDPTPLSIAVFGPPGSGKSFAIKQLARHLFGKERETLEWNLSQLEHRADLLSAFEQVRDATVRGKIPLVFWDEFDTGELAWIKEFLAPMQDAEYCSGSISHPFGKVIFIFAGGTASTFQEFNRSDTGDMLFRARKGPDFISRLRGYINIKGPNPHRGNHTDDHSDPVTWSPDDAYLIRRALLLRSIVTRSHPHLIDPVTAAAAISPAVVRGFLLAKRFLHGARSMEAIVAMSALSDARQFGVAELPSPDLLGLHVSSDFLDLVEAGESVEEAISVLALSPAWAELDDSPVLPMVGAHHRARVLMEHLRQVGYQVSAHPRSSNTADSASALPNADRALLLRLVHEHWLTALHLRGYDTGPEIDHVLRLHPAIQPFDDAPREHLEWLGTIIDQAIERLTLHGYTIEQSEPD